MRQVLDIVSTRALMLENIKRINAQKGAATPRTPKARHHHAKGGEKDSDSLQARFEAAQAERFEADTSYQLADGELHITELRLEELLLGDEIRQLWKRLESFVRYPEMLDIDELFHSHMHPLALRNNTEERYTRTKAALYRHLVQLQDLRNTEHYIQASK